MARRIDRKPVTVCPVRQNVLSDHSSQSGNPEAMQNAVTTENTALNRASSHSG